MKRVLCLITLALLIAGPAAAQKIYVDYDKTADFEAYKSFAWGPSPETSVRDTSPLMDSRIKNSIEYQLTLMGMIEDTKNPNVYVTYHTDEKEEMRLNTSSFGYDYGPGWGVDPYWDDGWGGMGGMGGMGSSTTTAYKYKTGTLLIDIWDAETEKVIWRGSASSVIPSNPAKEAKKIEKALKKMMKEWEKMYKKDQKRR